ncbi:MAG: hypothetical protein KDD01_12165 [Phaeodactylibacter sp.]|nr:hypothetical protein [Phaeodactylibacter sp.]
MEALLTLVVNLFFFYLLLGLFFALAFIWKGAEKIDPKTNDTSWFFKLLIMPGAIALWPYLLSKWVAKSKRL